VALSSTAKRRLANLRQHLQVEHPDLLRLVEAYARMDSILRGMRLIGKDESLTNRIAWWPVISAVGLFSSGKSTLINDLLGQPVQRTGNQAVDDKFTVIVHGTELKELPGTALDVDARFPFHAMGEEIEKVAPGEGKMVDRYLALKTVPSETMRGLVLVDSPGFDSDQYRHATLRLIDHILDLSDLTLVLFDARKPEPGVMRDTLHTLVARVKDRADLNKFLFILNQIDATSREDNLEEVVGAWQRAMASVGLAGGRFYSIYSVSAAGENEVQPRLREIRDRDMAEISRRIMEVPSVRGYRVANGLEAVIKDLREEVVPMLRTAFLRWWKLTNRITLGALILIVLAALGLGIAAGDPLAAFWASEPWNYVSLAIGASLIALARWLGARFARRRIARDLPEKYGQFTLAVRSAFLASTRFPAFLRRGPKGWSRRTNRKLDLIRDLVSEEVRRLNDRYARPGAKPEADAA